MMTELKQLKSTETLEEVIKKSTFIAIIGACGSVEDAQSFLQQHSVEGATHNCWAYKIGSVYRFNDDGEPGGTAGKPIFNAIDGQGFDNTVALVIRHYGGIKLGTGGLMRAYGGVVSRCLQAADFQPILHYSEIGFEVDFADVQGIHNLAGRLDAAIIAENYSATGVEMQVKILQDKHQDFVEQAENLLKGKIKFQNQ